MKDESYILKRSMETDSDLIITKETQLSKEEGEDGADITWEIRKITYDERFIKNKNIRKWCFM